MKLPTLLVAGAFALAALPAHAAGGRDTASAGSGPRPLTVATVPGVFQDALRHQTVPGFIQATGIDTRLLSWGGAVEEIAHQAGAGASWDVVEIGGEGLRAACDGKLLRKLDWQALGGKDRFFPQGVTECGVGAWMRGTVLTWDRSKLPAAPSWADFWDVAKYPGKRGLRREARGNLEIALLADGVAPGDVYATLGGKGGVDRAFRKLDQLKPYLVWWDDDARATELITSGDVLMSSAPSDRVVLASRAPAVPGGKPVPDFAIQWKNSLYQLGFWALPAGSAPGDAKGDRGLRFLAFLLGPDQQAAIEQATGLGSAVRAATDKLPADMEALVPSTPEHLGEALQIDGGFWRDNGARIEARFAEWLKH